MSTPLESFPKATGEDGTLRLIGLLDDGVVYYNTLVHAVLEFPTVDEEVQEMEPGERESLDGQSLWEYVENREWKALSSHGELHSEPIGVDAFPQEREFEAEFSLDGDETRTAFLIGVTERGIGHYCNERNYSAEQFVVGPDGELFRHAGFHQYEVPVNPEQASDEERMEAIGEYALGLPLEYGIDWHEFSDIGAEGVARRIDRLEALCDRYSYYASP